MALNYIFVGFFILSFVVAIVRTLGYYFRDFFQQNFNISFHQADLNVFPAMVESTFSMAETSLTIVIYLIGVMTLWLGIMKIGERAGAIEKLARWISPFFQKLFPEIPKNHPAAGSIIMNFSANMLGLDNAATPLGLKAMHDLQELNSEKETASNAQIMFLVLNTSGLTLIPISVLALRGASGAANPADVFIPILLATFFATLGGLIVTSIYQKINLFNSTVLKWLGSLILIVVGLIWFFTSLPQHQMETVSRVSGNFVLFSVIIAFLTLGLKRKINIYESFIEGAKEGFQVGVKIIPYLVAMLVAIGVFRASGTLDILTGGIKFIVQSMGWTTNFVDALPTAFMKPLSGSGARAMMVETMDNFGADSFAGRLSSIFQGSTETTFYTLAVYYGAINIKNTRYTATAGLIADAIGIISAILIAYLFFA